MFLLESYRSCGRLRGMAEQSIRTIFGLQPERSDSGSPTVDLPLLREFRLNPEISTEKFTKAVEMLGRYSEWRSAYRKLLDDIKATPTDDIPPPTGP